MDEKGYANPELLMTPRQLQGRLHDGATRIVDVRPTHEYVLGHIPGALHLDLYGISLNNTGQEAFEAFMWTLAYLMGSRGIGSDATVVFYENDSGMRAARGFWICEYLGHADVHVLDGGLGAWTAAGYATTREIPGPGCGHIRGRAGGGAPYRLRGDSGLARKHGFRAAGYAQRRRVLRAGGALCPGWRRARLPCISSI